MATELGAPPTTPLSADGGLSAQERLQLLASEAQARKAAERALDQLLSLQSLSDVLARALTPERVAAIVVDHAVVALGAAAGTVGVLSADGQGVDILTHKRNPPPARGRAHRRLDPHTALPVAESVRSEKPIWIESAAAWSERYPDLAAKRPREYRALAVSPFETNGRVGGAFALVFRENHQFSDTECLFMWLIARQCGQALERVRLYQAVAEREGRLQELVRRLFVGQEEERRRVAYELHDGLAQVAASTHQHLQVLASRFPPTSPEQREGLERALELAQRTVREARAVIRGLRPTVLDDFGLVRAILVELETLQADGWRITFEEHLGSTRLPPEVETALYRVLQEALTNVRKHARSTRVHVSLRRSGQNVRLFVRDHGVGFDLSEVRRTAPTRLGMQVGLTGIQERVSLLEGRCVIRSRPGRGTSIEVSLPCHGVPGLSR